VDPDQGRISLSMRRLSIDPWEEARKKYAIGSTLKVTISRSIEQGAVVDLDEGLEGFIPISELANRRIQNVEEVVQAGQEVEALVIDLRPRERRIVFSMRKLEQKRDRQVVDNYQKRARSTSERTTLGDLFGHLFEEYQPEPEPQPAPAAEADAVEEVLEPSLEETGSVAEDTAASVTDVEDTTDAVAAVGEHEEETSVADAVEATPDTAVAADIEPAESDAAPLDVPVTFDTANADAGDATSETEPGTEPGQDAQDDVWPVLEASQPGIGEPDAEDESSSTAA